MSIQNQILGFLRRAPPALLRRAVRLREGTLAARVQKHKKLSVAFWEKDQLAEAVPHLVVLCRLQPNDDQAVVDLAQALHQMGRDDMIEGAVAAPVFKIGFFWHLLGRISPSRITSDGTVNNFGRLNGTFLRLIKKSLAEMARARLRAELVIGLTGNEAAFFRILIQRWHIQQDLLKCLGLVDAPRRYLTNYWIRKIGHIGQMEFLYKAMQVGLVPSRKLTVLCASETEVANPALLNCWKTHLDVFIDEDTSRDLALEAQVLGVDIHCFDAADRLKPYYHKEAAAIAYRRWEEQCLPPLFEPPNSLVAKGRAALSRLGIPEDAWFVTVHVRESAFTHDKNGSPRNASITKYRLAMDEVVARGGYVIRIGDSAMQKLPAGSNFVDYARSDIKSDWMDVFLLSCCRFLIGVASGPAQVPPLFSIPCVYTNWMPMGDYPFNPSGILIHKKHLNQQTGQPIPYKEMMSICSDSQALLDRSNLALEENTELEILEVVREMLERLDGIALDDPEEDFLQSQFRLVAGLDRGRPKLGREFIKSNASLLR